MRADRLLSMIALLQTHGRMTAQQLSRELEVSERTIYRDVTALSTAGIPVYTEGGHGGGIALIEDYQTDLTKLNPDEVQALTLLDIPEPLVRLGMGQKLKAALLKLSAAIPPALRDRQVLARQRIHLDAAWWFQPEEPTPCLETLHQAAWQERLVRTTIQGDFGALIENVIAPYGLVAKASVWYLVYAVDGVVRARRVSRIVSAVVLEQPFERPADFNLAAFWQQWCAEFEKDRPRYEVQALVSPTLADRLPHILQNKQPDLLNVPPKLGKDGWQLMTLTFESFEVARTRLLGFGGAVEVLEPLALRLSLLDYAQQVIGRYSASS
jgi:predicted DNA-binding transcriptional regulator YafY